MSKKKKKKSKDNKPQLSKLDKAIYFAFTLIAMSSLIGLPYLIDALRGDYFFSNPDTVAWMDRMTTLWFIPVFFLIIITVVLFCEDRLDKRKAIFGNKKVDYTKHNYQFYPIFYKGNKPKRKMTETQKKERKFFITAWSVLFAFFCGLGCLGIFGRTELTRDGQIIKYSVFNNIKKQYYVSDISEVEYTTYLHNVAKGGDYYTYAVKLHLKNSDDYYIFEYKYFDQTNGQSTFTTSLDDMKYLRDYVFKDKKITYNKEVALGQIVKYNKMTQEEIEKLYEFFNENKN